MKKYISFISLLFFSLFIFIIGFSNITYGNTYQDTLKEVKEKGTMKLITLTGDIKDEHYNGINLIEFRVVPYSTEKVFDEKGKECVFYSESILSERETPETEYLEGRIFHKCYLRPGQDYALLYYDNTPKKELLGKIDFKVPYDREYITIGRDSKDIKLGLYSKNKQLNTETEEFKQFEENEMSRKHLRDFYEAMEKDSLKYQLEEPKDKLLEIQCIEKNRKLSRTTYRSYISENGGKSYFFGGINYLTEDLSEDYLFAYIDIKDLFPNTIHSYIFYSKDKAYEVIIDYNSPEVNRYQIPCDETNSVGSQERKTLADKYSDQLKVASTIKDTEINSKYDTNIQDISSQSGTIISIDGGNKDKEEEDSSIGSTPGINDISFTIKILPEINRYLLTVNGAKTTIGERIVHQVNEQGNFEVKVFKHTNENTPIVTNYYNISDIINKNNLIVIDLDDILFWLYIKLGITFSILVLLLVGLYLFIRKKKEKKKIK